MGYAQFISSSYRAYAVDFDEDGYVDLFNSVDDAIGSIANYLYVHGWKREGKIVTKTYPNNVRKFYKPHESLRITKRILKNFESPKPCAGMFDNLSCDIPNSRTYITMRETKTGIELLRSIYVILHYWVGHCQQII